MIARETSVQFAFLGSLAAVILALILPVSRLELLLVILLSAFVIVMESLNTLLERIIDLLEPRYQSHIGEIKDGLAGVVLLLVIFSAAMGLIIFWRPVFNFFSG